ncbi:MAG TPA: alpha/beta hydrolase [Candidatus Dormibacteraeota bacterium]|nr:alpha/beta hydrolase [Candidatus Dormibacteraeota bacterium]
MPRATSNGIELEYETFGDPKAPALLLISGLGSQLLSFDEDFCNMLASHGFYVIRFDNRDVGLSTYLNALGPADLGAALRGEPRPVYTLDDMAADAAGLLDYLGIQAAHVVGVSMGGFIAQLVALNHPQHVLTLTSIMSGPGGDDQVAPTPEGQAVLVVPARDRREDRIEQTMWIRKTLRGPHDEFDEAFERARAARIADRAYYPAGFGRQLIASIAAPSRVPRLQHLRVPTLVIHGTDDILIPVENGLRVASAVPHARILLIEGMGHDLPRRAWPLVVDAIAELAQQPAC